jgi:hypothetical protein
LYKIFGFFFMNERMCSVLGSGPKCRRSMKNLRVIHLVLHSL